jgi:hypothetical protein
MASTGSVESGNHLSIVPLLVLARLRTHVAPFALPHFLLPASQICRRLQAKS